MEEEHVPGRGGQDTPAGSAAARGVHRDRRRHPPAGRLEAPPLAPRRGMRDERGMSSRGKRRRRW